MKQRNYFWGFVLVLMAICLIAGQYDVFDGVSFWMVVLSILGSAVILDGIVHISINEIVIGGVLLFVLWKNQLGFHELSNWTILLAALLLLIGLNILFHPFKTKIQAWKMRRQIKRYNRQLASGKKTNPNSYGNTDGFNGSSQFTNNAQGNEKSVDGSYVWLKRSFTSSMEYVRSDNFQHADIALNFSGLKVYFDEAVIQGSEAVIHVEASFSGLELFIPSEWEIDDRLQHFAAGTEVKPRPQNIAPTKILRLEGSVNFSGVTVHYF